ncbi:MAG TPA: ATP-binding protein [Terriglobia bacterium]|nr:ATP-binding protein [Terriglobia bacterium]
MALTSPIFRKLLVAAFLLMVGTLLVMNVYLTRFTIRLQTENIHRRLKTEAGMLAAEAATIPPKELEQWSLESEARAHARVAVIDPHGIALADSREPSGEFANRSDQDEVQKALQGTTGISMRTDPALNQESFFLAVPLSYQGKPGYALQLSVALTDVQSATESLHNEIWLASLVALLVALVIAYFFSHSFTRRVNNLKAFAENLDKKPAAGSAQIYGNDELGDLGRSLDRTGARLRDLVDRLSLESARRESILASMVEGVLAVDNEFRITFCNDSFRRAVGSAGPIQENQSLLEVLRDPELLSMFTQVLDTHQPMKQRVRLAGAEGRSFEVQVTSLAGTVRGGAIAIFYDITDLERLERIRRDFVANVSHELRTPLTAISGYAETLLEGALEDQENNRKFVEIIKAHATRLGNIASDLLALSELESERPPAESRPVSVSAAVETAFRIIEPAAQLRGVTIQRGNQDEAEVLTERGRLEQALVNLLDNAVKFNRPGGQVQLDVMRETGDSVRIVVSDTGIGIPSTDLSRVFERFYRVDKARSREMGGTGLGLSIVKHVIERMNGTVSVQSQLGKGSTFTILLPVCPSDSPITV